MNWRRVAEMLHLAVPEPRDERSIKSHRLDELAAEVRDTGRRIAAIDKQSRLGSYSRVSIGPRR